MPQQKPRRSILESFEPIDPIDVDETSKVPIGSAQGKDGKPTTRSESPSPKRCRPAGYRRKRRAVASAVAIAMDTAEMVPEMAQRRAKITVVAWCL